MWYNTVKSCVSRWCNTFPEGMILVIGFVCSATTRLLKNTPKFIVCYLCGSFHKPDNHYSVWHCAQIVLPLFVRQELLSLNQSVASDRTFSVGKETALTVKMPRPLMTSCTAPLTSTALCLHFCFIWKTMYPLRPHSCSTTDTLWIIRNKCSPHTCCNSFHSRCVKSVTPLRRTGTTVLHSFTYVDESKASAALNTI